MKRSTTGKFLRNWEGESKKRVNLSLTETAWDTLDEFAKTRNLSRSEVIELYARSLRNDNGQFIDITETKKTQQALRESEARFHATAAGSFDAIYIFKSIRDETGQIIDFKFVDLNARGEQLISLPREAVIGQNLCELVPINRTAGFFEKYKQVVETKLPMEEEFSIAAPGIIASWLRHQVVPLEDGVAIISRDISEQKRIEAELRLVNERFQLATAAFKCLIYDWDVEQNRVERTQGLADIIGYRPEEAEPTPEWWNELVHPEDRPRLQGLATKLSANTNTFTSEYRIRHRDGLYRHIWDRGVIERNTQGQIVRIVGCSLDITDRRQSEERLKRYRLLSEHSRDIVLCLQSDGQILEANQAAVKAYGYELTELLSLKLVDLRAPRTHKAIAKQFQQASEQGILFETVHRRKDGSDFPVEVSAQSAEIGNEKVVLSIIRDITERKIAEAEREQLLARERQARAEAEKAQQQLSTIFETSPIGIGFLDHEQRFVAINEALAEINGLSREQHLGHTIPELFGVSDPGLVELFQTLYTTGKPLISPQLAVNVPGRDDRRSGYYNVYYLPTASQNGGVEGVLVYVVDVTEGVRLEQAQQYLSEASTVLSSSLDYQTTLEQLAQLTVPKLADWCTIHLIEDGAIEQLAVAHIDPTKLEWASQLRDKYPLDTNAARGAALTLRTGEPDLLPDIPDELIVQAARDSEHLQILRQVGFKSVMSVPLRAQEQVIGVISFIAAESGRHYNETDLAIASELARRASLAIENARLYRTAQENRAQAEMANRIKDEFLAVLSHELRTPLNPILGWARLLRTRNLDESKKALALETIERNAQLQAQLIEDLLDVSRILTGKLSLNFSPVNLATIIEAAIDTVRLSAEAKSIQIQYAIAPDVGQVLGDPNRLQQIVWNLVSNAIKFTPTGGRVDIHLEQIGTQAQICISDTGRGISADFLPYVFEAFRQADGTTTRMFGGLGLGLSIVRHLVELHGGTIQALSAGEGQGATFKVQLPLMEVQPQIAQENDLNEQTLNLNNIRVLAVDDDSDSLELLTFILEQHGAIVTAVASAADALTVLTQFKPDILVSDIGMPEMDGYMFIRQVRSSFPELGEQIQAIALTAYAGEYDQQQAISAGFQVHLSKPLEAKELILSIAQLLGR